MSRTDSRTLASCTASEHEVVVFPTPPLPPQKIHRSDFYVSLNRMKQYLVEDVLECWCEDLVVHGLGEVV
jgi:hypothetical protein